MGAAVHVRLIAALAIAGSALVLAAPAQAKSLRFEVISLKGKQTATWNDRLQSGCGEIARSGTQTISFKSRFSNKLVLKRIPRYTRAGKRNGFTYYGDISQPSRWTLDRTFSQSQPPPCPAEPAQNPDCGRRGPFRVPVNLAWRDGAIELRAVTGQIRAGYGTCEYAGFHEADLIDSKGRLSQRKLTRRRGRFKVRISGRVKEPAAESEGSQTTKLTAKLILRRLR